MDIVPRNITNDDGDGGDIVVGKFNGVDIKTTKEAIILEMNGGVGNKDDEQVVDQMDKENVEYGGNDIFLT